MEQEIYQLQSQVLLDQTSNQILQSYELFQQNTFKKEKSSTESFQFPINLILNRNLLQGQKQFKQLVLSEAGNTNLGKIWRTQKFKLPNQQTRVYVRCKYCEAKMIYLQDSKNCWTLISYNNTHIHDIENKKAYRLLMQKSCYENPVRSNKRKYENTSTSYANLLSVKKSLLKKPNFEILKSYLKFLKYDFKCDFSPDDMSKENYPQTLVAVSIQQKQNYRRYGECVSYSITYNCIKETAFNGKKFGLGIFSGFDNNNRTLIFGFSLMTFQTTQHFKNIFNWFFSLMGSVHTTAIITNQQKNLISTLQDLKEEGKYSYHHIYDNRYYIRSFRQEIKDKSKQIQDKIIEIMTIVISESDQNVGNFWLRKLKELMINQKLKKQYQKFEQILDHVSIWNMPKRFIGLSLYCTETLNEYLKIKSHNELNILEFLQKLDKISKQRSKQTKQYVNYPFQLLFKNQQIKEIRNMFQKKAFNAFVSNYHRSLYYKIQKEAVGEYQIIHIVDKYCYIINDKICQCGATQKTGIPCEHLIYINRTIYHQSYINLFDKRWLAHYESEKKQRRLPPDRKKYKKRIDQN